MVDLIGSFGKLQPIKALVVGDLMLDVYTSGKVSRISPEAPVPVLHVTHEEKLPGGAGNVMLNLIALGAKVYSLGRIGRDLHGQEMALALQEENVVIDGLFAQEKYPTPIKNRLIGSSQQLLRVDHEINHPISEEVEKASCAYVSQILPNVDIIAVSDYGKGFLSPTLLRHLIDEAEKQSIPVIIDPKGDDYSIYQGAHIIKPNLGEAYAAAKLSRGVSLEDVAKTIMHDTQCEHLVITKSEAGISLFSKNGERSDYPVKAKEVIDVTGAGDTVLAIMTLASANQLPFDSSLHLANVAASIVVERIGCVRVALGEIAERLLETDRTSKVFDEDHLFALEEALKNKPFSILGVNSQAGMHTRLFHEIRELSRRNPKEKLVLYLLDDDPDPEFVAFLSSLHEVNYVILHAASLNNLCLRIHPHEIFMIEDEKLKKLDNQQFSPDVLFF